MEVAEMVGKEHKHVGRDIRTIIEHLGDESTFGLISKYFTESTYKDNMNRLKPCYLLTKKGCELFATRMTGAKGTEFAVKYIERFNEYRAIDFERAIKFEFYRLLQIDLK